MQLYKKKSLDNIYSNFSNLQAFAMYQILRWLCKYYICPPLQFPFGPALGAESVLGSMRNDHASTIKKPGFSSKSAANKSSHMRRPSGGAGGPQSKKPKTSTLKDITLAEAGKYGSLNDFAFFDKVLGNSTVVRGDICLFSECVERTYDDAKFMWSSEGWQKQYLLWMTLLSCTFKLDQIQLFAFPISCTKSKLKGREDSGWYQCKVMKNLSCPIHCILWCYSLML